MLDDGVHEKVVDLGLGEGKIATVGDEDVIRLLGVEHLVDHFLQMIHLLFSIIVLIIHSFKVNIVVVVLVEGKAFRPAVVATFLSHHNREYVFL